MDRLVFLLVRSERDRDDGSQGRSCGIAKGMRRPRRAARDQRAALATAEKDPPDVSMAPERFRGGAGEPEWDRRRGAGVLEQRLVKEGALFVRFRELTALPGPRTEPESRKSNTVQPSLEHSGSCSAECTLHHDVWWRVGDWWHHEPNGLI